MSFSIQRWNWGIAAVVGALFATGVARATEKVLTPRDVARLRAAAGPAISPDAKYIAYLLMIPRDPYSKGPDGADFEDGPPWMELHVIGLPGDKQRPFITGAVSIERVKWLPDSSGISFLAKRGKDKTKSLYVIPVDGGEARRVLSHDTDLADYDWSPDGKRVAFLATKKQDKARKEREDKGFVPEIYEEDLDPMHVWIAQIDDDANKPRMIEVAGSVSAVHWFPNADRLALAVAPRPLVDDEYMKTKVVVVSIDDGRETARFANPGKLGRIAPSRNGQYVAMISAEDESDPAEGRLLLGDLSNGTLRDLLPDYKGHVSQIAWQNADTVMYIGEEGVGAAFGKVNVNGAGQKTIFKSDDVVLTAMHLSGDGMTGAFIGSSAQHPAELFTMKHGDTAPRRLTDSNPWLKDVRFAKQEVVNYKARDGLALQGILILPLDRVEGTRYPLILCVHGGPEAHEQNGWLTNYSRPGQVAAAQGFAVFYPNYRGSTGRGVAFSKLGQADEAGKEFDDLVDAIDYLEASGLIDDKKVGITGGSYGGYASAWAATALTDRFAAAVMFVGISNTISKKGTTDIPNEDFLVHTRGRVWDNWQFHLERSPIYHVKNAHTPILILAGKNDTRVDPSQSKELYRHLRTLGQVPVRLVLYPGEGHGNRKASSRLDYNLRMMQWMEHYLKGSGGEPPPFDIDYGFEAANTPASQPTETTDEK